MLLLCFACPPQLTETSLGLSLEDNKKTLSGIRRHLKHKDTAKFRDVQLLLKIQNTTAAIMENLDQLIDSVLTDDANSKELFNAVSSLAKLSREEVTVRTRLALRDVLQRLVKILKTHPRTLSAEDLLAATLRCVGNACVSNLEACKLVSESNFDWYHAFLVPEASLDHDSAREETPSPHWTTPPTEVRELTIKVLYNICSQSEEAQRRCYLDGIDVQIFTVLAGGDNGLSPVENPSLAIDLLFWVTSHHRDLAADEKAKGSHSGGQDPDVLYSGHWDSMFRATCLLWEKVDVEDYATLMESVLVFLRDPKALRELSASLDTTSKVWRILACTERKIQEAEAEGDAEDVKLLVALSTSLTWILSDVSASPAFASTVSAGSFDNVKAFVGDLSWLLTTGVTQSRVRWQNVAGDIDDVVEVIDGDSLRLTSAACQIVGNLLHGQVELKRSDGDQPEDTYQRILDTLTGSGQSPATQNRHIHQRLFALMTASDNADFLHSAAGFLIQLSRPSPEVREEIASDSNALPAIRRLGQHTMQQLNQDALMLMRALGKDTPSVQEKFKEVAGEVMATVAETQKAAAEAQAEQPAITSTA